MKLISLVLNLILPQSIFYQKVPVEGEKCCRNLAEVKIFVEK